MRLLFPLVSISLALLCSQCATTPAVNDGGNGAAGPAANLEMPGIDTRALNQLSEGGTGADVRIPILRAPSLEKQWGKPKLTVAADGSYCLYYSNPKRSFQHLAIYGSPAQYTPAGAVPPAYMDITVAEGRPTTAPVTQKWQTVSALGRNLRYCVTSPDSGADVAELTTETVTLTAPDGRTASYCLSGGSDLDAGPLSMPALFRAAKF